MTTRYRKLAVLAAVFIIFGVAAALPAAASGPSHTQITGTGSSWSANAVNQWISDVNSQGLQVVFTSTGSAQGRKDFAYKTTDFGVSDIAYQGTDPITHQNDTSNGRKFVYLPIVAGGTSFPYNLSFAGHRIRNLRLSGPTLAKIFTNKIKYWDDPAVKADNNNKLLLPHIPVIPVVHSEGSGSTYQFTAYLAKTQSALWTAFSGNGLATEYFPRAGTQQAQNGSDGVMNFITSSAGNGSIGFDEYSYAKLANFPVAKVLNANGYYTAPTQYNVAVALQKAVIQDTNPSAQDYLTQDLKYVYTDSDPRTYPLSSYSYMIIPTSATDSKTSKTAQRQTLADFLNYSICQGQGEVGPIGYSPLPINLVQDGFGQIAKLKAADHGVDLANANVANCHNPTFIAGQPKKNYLAQIAPKPPACDKTGAGPCAADVGIITANPVSGKAPASSGSGSTGGTRKSARSTSGGGTTAGSNTAASGSGATAAPAGTSVDPNTGQIVSTTTGQDTTTGANNESDLVGNPTTLAAAPSNSGFDTTLYVLVSALLLALLVGPVALSRYLAARRVS